MPADCLFVVPNWLFISFSNLYTGHWRSVITWPSWGAWKGVLSTRHCSLKCLFGWVAVSKKLLPSSFPGPQPRSLHQCLVQISEEHRFWNTWKKSNPKALEWASSGERGRPLGKDSPAPPCQSKPLRSGAETPDEPLEQTGFQEEEELH